jgi:hypothetical protein
MHFSFREIPALQKEKYYNALLFQGNPCTPKGRIL